MYLQKLSIIIPVYNVADYVSECVDSILSQSLKQVEIILVDDGSTDTSGFLCDQYAQRFPNIRVIHKKNGGLSSARNAGLDIQKGEYITFVDSDDVIVGTDTFMRVMACFQEDQNLDVVQYDVIHQYLSDEAHKRNYPFKTYKGKDDILEGYLRGHIHVSCCDKVFRAEVFHSIRFPIGEISEDIAVIPRIIENVNKMKTANIGYYGYRYRKGSISTAAPPCDRICSIIRSYYAYHHYAMQFKRLESIAVTLFADTIWAYASLVRKNYPEKKDYFCENVVSISLSFRKWIHLAMHLSPLQAFKVYVVCVLGICSVFSFQRFVTRG